MFDFNLNINLRGGPHLLRGLGLDPDSIFEQLGDFRDQMQVLGDLRDSFQGAGMATQMLAHLLATGGIPPSGFCMPPNAAMGRCPCAGSYAQPQTYDFGAAPGVHPFSLPALMQRGQGARLEAFLGSNPSAKAQMEMMLGGHILPDGCADGRLTVIPFQNGGLPASAPPAAIQALAALNQISHAAMAMGFLPGAGGNPFSAMVLGALSNLMSGGGVSGAGGPGGGSPYVDWADAQRGRRGQGMHGAGENHPAQGAFGLSPGGADETAAILNDSSLTVEDKVCLMLMAIMKKMDEEIEKQAQYVNSLQQQQNKKGGKGGGKGGKGGGGGGGSSPSIDVETMKLKRLIDKRGQMFDMLRQIIDKYNETAKNVIQSMGR